MESRQRAEEYQELLDDVVMVDERVAFIAFDIGCATTPRLPLVDALIAAAARERDACLVHRDRHMAPIPADLVEQLKLPEELEAQ